MHQLAQKLRTRRQLRHLANCASGPVIAFLISVAAMAQALKVWQWRAGDPVDLSGDSPAALAQIKGMLDHGTYASNPDLGAPFHQDGSWFPQADQLHLLLTGKVIGLFSTNPFTVSAIYFFLGFPLASLSMYWLTRQRDVGRLGSVVAGVLFSVLPGHQMMFEHLWLASYWVVPLGVWLILRAALGEELFRVKVSWHDPAERRAAIALNLTTVFCVICIAIGGIYFSAFTLLLLAVTLLVRRVATGDPRTFARALLLPGSIGWLSLAAVFSVIGGQDKSTLVTTPAQRSLRDSEIYSGRLMDLILPWTYHRVGVVRDFVVAYNSQTTPSPEGPAVGLIALAGVVLLLFVLLSTFVPQPVRPARPEIAALGVLTLVSLSFYSFGGLGSFVALFVTPQIRTWSRFFIFIGLFGLLAVGHWLTALTRRKLITGLLAAVTILIGGILDQTNPGLAPQYKDLRNQISDLTTFSARIESKVGSGCAVFQLPVTTFPFNDRIHDMQSYSHLRPYLASSSLRWSYGAFSGTSLADWQLALPQRSTTDLVNDLVSAGFCAVEVDRTGFGDGAAVLEKDLRSMLGASISKTRDDRLLAWDLSSARRALTSRVGAQQIKATGDLVLHPMVVYTDAGAQGVAHDKKTPYQWISNSAKIDVHNFGGATTHGVHLTFSLAAPDSAPRRFEVHLPTGRTLTVQVAGRGTRQAEVVLNAAPGRNSVTITTNGSGVTLNDAPSSSASANGEIVYGKLIDLHAHIPEAQTHIGVVQQLVD